MLYQLSRDPESYASIMDEFTARTTCRLAWGTPRPAAAIMDFSMALLYAVTPDGPLGNILPWTMKLPSWLVPSKWNENKGMASEGKLFQHLRDEVLFDDAEEKRESWTQLLFDHHKETFGTNLEGAYAVGMHGMIGAATMTAPLQSLCLALCYYPQYQAMLHEEVDRVLGDRMPTIQDMRQMPVVRAFVCEIMRWRPPSPSGIPHALAQDDEYHGYHISAGSWVFPPFWTIGRDPETYPKPDDFNPARWLDPAYPTYREPLDKYPTISGSFISGYGVRVCPGQAFAESVSFLAFASLAWHFNVRLNDEASHRNDDLQTTDPTMNYTPFMITKPYPFPMKLEVRSQARLEVLLKKQNDLEATDEFNEQMYDREQFERYTEKSDKPWDRVLEYHLGAGLLGAGMI